MKNLEKIISDLKSVGLHENDAQRLRNALLTLEKLDLSNVASTSDAGTNFYGSSELPAKWSNSEWQSWNILNSIRTVRHNVALHRIVNPSNGNL